MPSDAANNLTNGLTGDPKPVGDFFVGHGSSERSDVPYHVLCQTGHRVTLSASASIVPYHISSIAVKGVPSKVGKAIIKSVVVQMAAFCFLWAQSYEGFQNDLVDGEGSSYPVTAKIHYWITLSCRSASLARSHLKPCIEKGFMAAAFSDARPDTPVIGNSVPRPSCDMTESDSCDLGKRWYDAVSHWNLLSRFLWSGRGSVCADLAPVFVCDYSTGWR